MFHKKKNINVRSMLRQNPTVREIIRKIINAVEKVVKDT